MTPAPTSVAGEGAFVDTLARVSRLLLALVVRAGLRFWLLAALVLYLLFCVP